MDTNPHRVALVLCVVIGAVAVAVILGWFADIGALRSVLPGFVAMKVNTALLFLLLSAALAALALKPRVVLFARAAQGAAAVVAVIAATAIAEYALGTNVGLDELLVVDATVDPNVVAGRMAGATAVAFLLCGATTSMIAARSLVVAQALAGILFAMSMLMLLGYMYGATLLYRTGAFGSVAVHTAACFALFSVAALALCADAGFMRTFLDHTVTAAAARRLFPILFVVPVVLGWLRLRGQDVGLYDTEFGVAILTSGNIIVLAIAAGWGTRAMARAEANNLRLQVSLAEERTERMAGERFRAVTNSLAEGVVAADEAGRVVAWNQQALCLLGRTETEVSGADLDSLLPRGEGDEIEHVTPDGSRRVLEISRTQQRGETIVHNVASFRDVSERVMARDALMRSEERFRLLLDCAPFAVAAARGTTFVYANAFMGRMLGYDDVRALVGTPVLDRIHPEERQEVVARLSAMAAQDAEPPSLGPVRMLRRDGTELLVASDSVATMLEGERTTIGAVRDVTAEMAAAAQLRTSLAEKEMLLKEVHHRVKNNLAVVISLLNLQAEKLTDHRQRLVFGDMRARVYSIALVHERLYRASNLAELPLEEYLEGLGAELMQTFGTAEAAIDFAVRAEGIHLGIEQAVPVALLVNELLTNACKHAFPGRARGRIEVSVQREQGGAAIELVVADDGVGMPEEVELGAGGSLGMTLIVSLARQLGARPVVERAQGTRWSFRFQQEGVQ